MVDILQFLLEGQKEKEIAENAIKEAMLKMGKKEIQGDQAARQRYAGFRGFCRN
jgi:hypothetical protein